MPKLSPGPNDLDFQPTIHGLETRPRVLDCQSSPARRRPTLMPVPLAPAPDHATQISTGSALPTLPAQPPEPRRALIAGALGLATLVIGGFILLLPHQHEIVPVPAALLERVEAPKPGETETLRSMPDVPPVGAPHDRGARR